MGTLLGAARPENPNNHQTHPPWFMLYVKCILRPSPQNRKSQKSGSLLVPSLPDIWSGYIYMCIYTYIYIYIYIYIRSLYGPSRMCMQMLPWVSAISRDFVIAVVLCYSNSISVICWRSEWRRRKPEPILLPTQGKPPTPYRYSVRRTDLW